MKPPQRLIHPCFLAVSVLAFHAALCTCIGLRPPGMSADVHPRSKAFFRSRASSSTSHPYTTFTSTDNNNNNTDSSSFTATTTNGVAGPNGWGTFSQLVDHADANAALGTFEQRFWYGTQHWRGPSSPVLLVTPGEQSATGFNETFLTDQRIIGRFAEAVGAAVVILEHRYWGSSSPYAALDGPRLRYLTIDNALADLSYFAHRFTPPFDSSGRSGPVAAPWILAGGSYPGALAAWEANRSSQADQTDQTNLAGHASHTNHTSRTSHVHTDNNHSPFWAFYATSGVVQAVGNFWQYFDVVRQASPANCSADLSAAIAYVDEVLINGSQAQKLALKAKFLLEDLEDADFANALTFGPVLWQETQFFSEAVLGFNSYHMFCNYIENVWPNSTSPAPGPEGVGVCKALDGYAKWFKEIVLPGLCESLGYGDFQGLYNPGCLANLNASSPMHTDLSPDNPFDRQWSWLICNEPLAWFQDAPPAGSPSIISRLVSYEYNMAQCALMFPASAGGFGLQHGRTPADVNAVTGGWSVPPERTPRLLYANGELDPWRPATVSASSGRPGGPLASTADVPVYLIPGGGHCSDIYAGNWAANPDVEAAADSEAATLARWVAKFYRERGLVQP